MWRDKVLGVIDLLDGSAVHAVAGRRGEYRPHDDTARSNPNPLILAEKYRQAGVGGLYVADLDALTGAPWQADLLSELAGGELPIWLDAGIRSVRDWRQKRAQLDAAGVHWILATETFDESADQIEALDDFLADDEAAAELTVGIDLHTGQVLYPSARKDERQRGEDGNLLPQATPLAVVEHWAARGIRSFLPLELSSVGVSRGPATEGLCRQIRQKFPQVQLLSGGGVRDQADLQRLFEAGCDRVLVATALLNGNIAPPGRRPLGNKS
ncbi:HisA/HisF-related TIM barrel protein [Roseimaritima ulvae]|uniref:1-(5-phosphoribosyl)-5-[(5-phosphoribosylamino)methylideneamino] imidazole-4-carboxamide isomerase n=1 Tax=Roseimaritima ulvae TaxID=980254 RepID=A0A5B9R174_9BACT|nr:HisA/HisF-related TIM barrel protein [Roseimaritima ulvae]QEG39941.1 1-(5-phosphoribosyl)-5-[(5-phosphoribosylamino)methylideneamino] imidazole-4-carboxamide isomerase [Roseimaritima ulvae]